MKITNINKQNKQKKQEREKRLATQLRQNLFKRKQQLRQRQGEEAENKLE